MDALIFGYIGWFILLVVMIVLIYTNKKDLAKTFFMIQFVVFTLLLTLTLFKIFVR